MISYIKRMLNMEDKNIALQRFWFALNGGDENMAEKVLMEETLDPNVKTPEGASLIEFVTMESKDPKATVRMVDRLLNMGAKVGPQGRAKRSPLSIIMRAGIPTKEKERLCERMIKLGADVSFSGDSPIWTAIYLKSKNLVELLLKNGVNPNGDIVGRRNKPLNVAAELANEEMINVLIEYGGELKGVNGNGENVLHSAISGMGRHHCIEESIKLTEWLLGKGVDFDAPNRRGATPLAEAALRGISEVMEVLLDMGARSEGEPKGMNPLECFLGYEIDNVTNKDLALLERLTLNIKPDIQLMEAAITKGEGALSKVEFLLKKGFDVNEVNENGETALFKAVMSGKSLDGKSGGRADIVLKLLNAGCSHDIVSKSRKKAIFYAVGECKEILTAFTEAKKLGRTAKKKKEEDRSAKRRL